MNRTSTELEFQAKLKDIYRNQDKIPQLIEGLDKIPQQSLKDYYISLQTIIKEDDDKKSGNYEEISAEKKEIQIQDLFNAVSGQQEAHKVLILGGAGVGKTTILQYMAYQWSIGELWADKFDYVYRASLKSLLNKEWKTSPWAYQPHQLNESLLKCLIHHNLALTLSRKEVQKLLPPEQLPLGERTLILLDGYDEVAHLANTQEYKDIQEEMFDNEYMIMTSRPNAVKKSMKENFDRKIENMGLDDHGIDQYCHQYFRDAPQMGQDLLKFLSDTPLIKSICKVPVNITMLCYIWSETESLEKIQEISHVTNLYQEVVKHLGHRYIAKRFKGEKEEGYRLEEKLDNGQFVLDELKVMTHTAFKGLTGGKIAATNTKSQDDDGAETLIIRGGLDNKEDEHGISLQSSINFLTRRRLLNDDHRLKVTVQDVFRYGLLKIEGTVAGDTDFQKQAYTFIHLTFQEYLTAYYLKEVLKNGTEQEKTDVCQFIAEHRNEPRYLMTLKFMAGAISLEKDPGDKVHKMFWDAIVCNADGFIELGVEAKISLLMHLLSQAKMNGTLDPRIPHLTQMTNLIDAVVLDDITTWSNQLRESDYMSDTIKEGLLSALSEGYQDWYSTKIKDIQANLSPELQVALSVFLNKKKNFLLPVIGLFANKLTLEEQRIALDRLKKIIINYQSHDWQVVEQAVKIVKHPWVQNVISQDEARVLIETIMDIVQSRDISLLAYTLYDGLFQIVLKNSPVARPIQREANQETKKICEFAGNFLADLNYCKMDLKSWVPDVIAFVKESESRTSIGKVIVTKILSLYRNEQKSDHGKDVAIKRMISQFCTFIEDEAFVIQTIEEFGEPFLQYSFVSTLTHKTKGKKKIVQTIFVKLKEAVINAPQESFSLLCSVVKSDPALMNRAEIADLAGQLTVDHIIKQLEPERFDYLYYLRSDFGNDLLIELFRSISLKVNNNDQTDQITTQAMLKVLRMISDRLEDQSLTTELSEILVSFLTREGAKDILIFTLNQVTDMIADKDSDALIERAFEKVVSLISHDDKDVKLAAIETLCAINKSPTSKLNYPALVELINLLTNDDTDTLGTIISRFSISSACFKERVKEDEDRVIIKVISSLDNLLSHQNERLVELILLRLEDIARRYNENSNIRRLCFEIGMKRFSSGNNTIKLFSIQLMSSSIRMKDSDEDAKTKCIEKLSTLTDSSHINVENLIPVVSMMLNRKGGKASAPEIFAKLENYINGFNMHDETNDGLEVIADESDKDIAILLLRNALKHLNEKDCNIDKAVYIKMLASLVSTINDKKIATDVCSGVYAKYIIFMDKVDETLRSILMDYAKILAVTEDRQLAEQYLTFLENLSGQLPSDDMDPWYTLCYICHETVSIISPKLRDEGLVLRAIKMILQVCKKDGDMAFGFFEELAELLLLVSCSKEFIEIYNSLCLKEDGFSNKLDIFIIQVEHMEELLKKVSDNPDMIPDYIETLPQQVFVEKSPNSQEGTKEGKKVLKKTPSTQDLLKDLARKTFIEKTNRFGFRPGYEVIPVILVLKEYADTDTDRGNGLVDSARKVLDIQIKYLDDEGLEWISRNFDLFSYSPKESKVFFKKLSHKLLSDRQMTPLEKDLIIKFINQGVTISISRTGDVILEDKKYTLEGENVTLMLEEMARAVIDQEEDILGVQYKTHRPIFPKSVEAGMKKASSDIEIVHSVVNKSYRLSGNQWLLTQLKDANNKELVLLEQRSAIGDLLVYQVGKQELVRLTPANTEAKLKEMFQNYFAGTKYSGSSLALTNQEAAQIISGQSTPDYTTLSKEQTRTYFLDELLGQKGSQDRINYLEEELSLKMTNYERGASFALNKSSSLVPADKVKIKEYYKAFVGTFAAVYTTSQVVDSGQVTNDTSPDTVTSLLSTLASFAPFIGDQLSSAITSVGEFMKTQEMLNSARKMKNLASDSVSLNQLIGECAFKIVMNKQKQEEIISATDADQEQVSGPLYQRVMNLVEKMQEKVDTYLYKQMYTTPAAKLGNNDANEAIQAWVMENISEDDIQEQIVRIVTKQNISAKDERPPEVALEAQPSKNRECCGCRMF